MSVSPVHHLKDSSFDLASFESLHLCFISKKLTSFAGLEAVFAETFHHVVVILPIHRQRGQPEDKSGNWVTRCNRIPSSWKLDSIKQSGFSECLWQTCAFVPASLLHTTLYTLWLQETGLKCKALVGWACLYLLHCLCLAPSSGDGL